MKEVLKTNQTAIARYKQFDEEENLEYLGTSIDKKARECLLEPCNNVIDFMQYNGYIGSIEFDKKNNMLVGRILNGDTNVYYTSTVGLKDLNLKFMEIVDDIIKENLPD